MMTLAFVTISVPILMVPLSQFSMVKGTGPYISRMASARILPNIMVPMTAKILERICRSGLKIPEAITDPRIPMSMKVSTMAKGLFMLNLMMKVAANIYAPTVMILSWLKLSSPVEFHIRVYSMATRA